MGCKEIFMDCTIDPAAYRRRAKNKTADQRRVLDYFVKTGLIPMLFGMKDEEYDALVQAKRNSIDIKKMALSKIGLDEEQVSEIPPITFEGYEYEGLDCWRKIGKDGNPRSSAYGVTQLFFSDTQVYAYQLIFSLDDNSKKERTEEYFYRDVTNFSASTESQQIVEATGCMGQETERNVDIRRFSIVVPGEKFTCSTSQDIDRQLSAMKAKLREKKQV